ncbi:18644_t:CDS:2 [Funneliformis geosporum]|uniref:15793_t:CDS:1 n=1 Tax=Funneliformis geosporum TaxID=1117311 RepID=A0A9W4WP21_9GLOM|nr:18644_t:CDS:2 [Funneliformis geosporum]CAI2176302.1 15793_t:CDS:2 [Funneliformis geosporum]
MSIEKEPLGDDYCRRKVLLAYNPNSITNSQHFYEWALSNIFRPNLDHVYLVSVINTIKQYYPKNDMWAFGLGSYPNIDFNFLDGEYQNNIKNEQERANNLLKVISCELTRRNITSKVIIAKEDVREALVNICKSVKPDIILVASASKRSKILLKSPVLKHVRKHMKDIPVITDVDDDLHRKHKNNKVSEPKVSKQKISRVIKKIKQQLRSGTDVEPLVASNITYHKLD